MPVQLSEEVISRFRVSAVEKVAQIEEAWERISDAPDDELLHRVRRELHTLKGDAHIFGFRDASALCHKLEELIEAASRHLFQVSDEFDLMVTMAIRYVGALVLRRPGRSSGGVERFVREIDEALAAMPAGPTPASPRARPATMAPRVATGERDRLSPETRARLSEIATEVFVEALVTGADAGSRLGRAWRALVGEIGRLRAVRLDQRLERHAQAARLLADDLGKPLEVAFDVPAEAVSARVVDAVDEAVLHAVRNAVDHGIEAPEWREALGKPAQARLAIRARVTALDVEIEVEDDGAGVDLAAVRRRAVERGIVTADQAAALSDEAAAELVFAPGFSTRDRAGELSGRGIGLDAMRAAVAAEDGTVVLRSASGQGSTLRVRVPHERPFVEVHRLALGPAAFLAVARDWAVTADDDGGEERGGDDDDPTGERGPAELDPWTRYGLAALRERAGLTLALSRSGLRVVLRGTGAPAPATAQRLCPTPAAHPLEIVRIDGVEGLLLRPDALLRLQQREQRMR